MICDSDKSCARFDRCDWALGPVQSVPAQPSLPPPERRRGGRGRVGAAGERGGGALRWLRWVRHRVVVNAWFSLDVCVCVCVRGLYVRVCVHVRVCVWSYGCLCVPLCVYVLV